MTIAESSPVSAPGTQEPASPPARRSASLSVVDTTELRWFVARPLPREVRDWFTGSTGVLEERFDSYLLDGRHSAGTKRRFREVLELKVRQSIGERIELDGALAGAPELWRKWSPADGLVGERTDGPWIDVHKSIVKRRFAADGTEVAFASGAPMPEAGCDVEVASVEVGDVQAWTLAFAAFGPTSCRSDALRAAFRALNSGAPPPETFRPGAGRAMGYPEWLTRTLTG
ncbi:MAG: hypothetical protein ACR2O6_05240 [Ilumatobacteraceae bacterium]